MTPTQAEEQARAIKKVVIGAIISEYGCRELSNTKQELKQRTNAVINSVRQLENWFKYNPNSNDHYREVFKKEFLKSEIFLISELLETVWGLNEESLEDIIKALKENIAETKNQESCISTT